MNKNLTEGIELIKEISKPLILVSDEITLQEGRELLTELDLKFKEKLAKVKKYYFDQLAKLKDLEKKARKGKKPGEIEFIMKPIRTAKMHLRASYLTSLKILNKSAETSFKSIKSGLLKKNHANLKGLKKLKTGSKVGIATGIIGAVAAAAYNKGK